MSILSIITTILRDPGALLEKADNPQTMAHLIPRLLAIIMVSAALFGTVVGSWRGGLQLPYAAIKMPFLFLIPLVVGLPAVRAICAASGVEISWNRMWLSGLISAGRASVLAAALGPVLWLLYSVVWDYHVAVLLLATSLALVAIPGLTSIRLAVPNGGKISAVAATSAVLILGLLSAQTGWLLRPFIARPTVEVAFLRPVEEDIASALMATTKSSLGHYDGWEAEGSGLFGKGLQQDTRQEATRR